MGEVFINQEIFPYVLDIDGTLDLAGLDLQPASIVIKRSVTVPTQMPDSSRLTGPDLQHVGACSKKGLVDVQTCKTKRRFADIQQDILHDITAGSKAHPLHISGAHVAGMCICSLLALQSCKTHHVALDMCAQSLVRLQHCILFSWHRQACTV